MYEQGSSCVEFMFDGTLHTLLTLLHGSWFVRVKDNLEESVDPTIAVGRGLWKLCRLRDVKFELASAEYKTEMFGVVSEGRAIRH